jgi:catechol 2,3-dioxygenase-like lactoylglutathione lyase family enzyme
VKVEALDHIHIYSDDPSRSCEFYKSHLSATEISRKKSSEGHERVFLDIAGHIVVIGNFPNHFQANPRPELPANVYAYGVGLAHFGVMVNSVEEVLPELEANKIEYVEAPKREGVKQQIFLKAPDGVFVEVSEY